MFPLHLSPQRALQHVPVGHEMKPKCLRLSCKSFPKLASSLLPFWSSVMSPYHTLSFPANQVASYLWVFAYVVHTDTDVCPLCFSVWLFIHNRIQLRSLILYIKHPPSEPQKKLISPSMSLCFVHSLNVAVTTLYIIVVYYYFSLSYLPKRFLPPSSL